MSKQVKPLQSKLNLICFFCKSNLFVLPYKDYQPYHGSFLVCANCGRENDYTSLSRVVYSRAQIIVDDYANEVINNFANELKKSFQGNKYIKWQNVKNQYIIELITPTLKNS
jgi:hypothetical protein